MIKYVKLFWWLTWIFVAETSRCFSRIRFSRSTFALSKKFPFCARSLLLNIVPDPWYYGTQKLQLTGILFTLAATIDKFEVINQCQDYLLRFHNNRISCCLQAHIYRNFKPSTRGSCTAEVEFEFPTWAWVQATTEMAFCGGRFYLYLQCLYLHSIYI